MRTRVSAGVGVTIACLATGCLQHSVVSPGGTTPDARVAEQPPATSCRAIVALTSYDFSVISAAIVPASKTEPEHCRVTGVIPPEIRFEVNLPARWNRRFYMYGNGGYAGESPHPRRRAAGLAKGFAVASTDTGHDRFNAPLATFAHDNLQKLIDYAFRAVHLTAVTAKTILTAYYGDAPSYSYWEGCSTGGRQGLLSAQRYPSDFDGIVAGAPVLDFTNTQLWGIWNAQALDGVSMTIETIDRVGDIVYARCDALDGLADGLIEDPRQCDFDPARHLPSCEGDRSDDQCFSSAQIAALGKVYAGARLEEGLRIDGLPVGAEKGEGWYGWLINPDGPIRQLVLGEAFLKYMAFQRDDPDLDWRAFDFAEDLSRIGDIRLILDATDPNMRAYRARGGKILSYFGWADTALNPLMATNYYESVMQEMGKNETRDFYRLYMVPGMFHCSRGLGVDRFDAFTALVDWVERGKVPQDIVAARIEEEQTVRTRLLCPYPESSRYTGSGDIDSASSFECTYRAPD